MNKKFLLMLPLAGLFLTSCGAPTKLPKGYTSIDGKDEAKTLAYATKVTNMITKSYEGALTGVKATLEASVDKVVYTDVVATKEREHNYSVTVEDAGFTLEIAATGLDKTAADYAVSVKLMDIHAKIKVDWDQIKVDTEIKGADIAVYVNKFSAYVDLSDEGFKKAIRDVGGAALGALMPAEEGAPKIDYAKEIEGLVEVIGDKFMVRGADITTFLDVETDITKFTLPSVETIGTALTTLPKTIAGFVTYVKGFSAIPENPLAFISDCVTFADYDDDRVGAAIVADFADKAVQDNVKLSVKGELAAVADKKGRLGTVGGEADVKVVVMRSESKTRTCEVTGAKLDLTMKYGVKKLSMPKDSDYKLIPLGLIAVAL